MNFNEFVQYQARIPVNRNVIAFKALPITYSTDDKSRANLYEQARRLLSANRLQSKKIHASEGTKPCALQIQ